RVRFIQADRFMICKRSGSVVKMTGQTSRRNRKPDDAMKAAIAFVECINACDADGSCKLITKDHRFVDSTGAAHVGRERMREAWLQYFAMFPDYRIAISTTFSSGERAALFGTTCATYAANGVRVEMLCGVAGRCAQKADC